VQREEMTADDKSVTLSDITEKDAAVSSLASCTGLQGRKRGTELVRHRSFDLHRFIVLAPIRVVKVALESCCFALCNLISINLIVFN
jgi:hypothetical protein